MIITEQSNNVKKSSTFEETNFSFKNSSQAFSVITTNLYKNAKKAIIRELACNAYDAQLDSGTKKPFYVHIPRYVDPVFYIRDYGTGISPEKIKDVYTVVFESDKNDSDDRIGGFGLGSKTPFSYSDSFIVESFVDGTKYTYNAIKENGIPKLIKLSEELTDEDNGLKVEFDVDSNDIHAFEENARDILQWFDNCQCNIEIRNKYENETPIVETDDFSLYERQYYDDKGVFVKMSNVVYKVSLSEVGVEEVFLGHHDFIMNANIGDVSVETARESVHYDDKTINFIRNIYKKAVNHVKKEIQDELNEFDCEFEARKVLHKKTTLVHASVFRYNDKPLKDWRHWTYVDYDLRFFEKHFSKCKKHHRYIVSNINKSYLFYENDLKIGGIKRAQHQAKTNDISVYLIPSDNVDEFCEDFGINKSYIEKISSVENPTSSKKAKGDFRVFEKGGIAPHSYWVDGNSLPKKAVYCNTEYSKITDFSIHSDHPKYLEEMLRFLESKGVNIPKIYSVTKKDSDKIKKSMTNIVDFLYKEFNKLISSAYEMVEKENTVSHIRYHELASLFKYRSWMHFNEDHEIFRHMNKVYEYFDENQRIDTSLEFQLKRFYGYIKKTTTLNQNDKIDEDIKDSIEFVKNSYPLVHYFGQWNEKEVLEYIKLYEEKNNG